MTGATQRVGLCCVERLLERGERVVITYRRQKPVLNALRERGVVCLQADFSDATSVNALIQTLQQDIGPLRAIVHNASCWPRDSDPGVDLEQILDDVLAVHVRAPYLINMHCEGLLRAAAQPWADVVHITDYVVEKGSTHHIAYAAAKAGLANLTLSFAKRFAPSVKVNTIAPSLLMFNDDDDAEYRSTTLKKSVLGIEPGPEVVWQSLAFLLDNAYMTGRTLSLDGGRHIR